MSRTLLTHLPNRAVVAVGGSDAETFLQGLVSNDVARTGEGRAIYATLLTPQGKFLFDFFIVRDGEEFLLDCEADRKDALMQRLQMYRLRADVAVRDVADGLVVAALFGDGALKAAGLDPASGAARRWDGGWIYADPRLPAAGARIIRPKDAPASTADALAAEEAGPDAYERWRLELGLPDGSRDMIPNKAFLLESGVDDLNGIDWEKGCYVGQETTARTKHRATVRKRLLPVMFEGSPPEFDTPITDGDKEVGVMRSGGDGRGLALVRLDPWQAAQDRKAVLRAGRTAITIQRPDWAKLPPASQAES